MDAKFMFRYLPVVGYSSRALYRPLEGTEGLDENRVDIQYVEDIRESIFLVSLQPL